MHDFRKEQGRELARLRKFLGLSQTKMGELLDAEQKTVSHWERGQGRMQLSALRAALKHPIKLFEFLNKPPKPNSPLLLCPFCPEEIREGKLVPSATHRARLVDEFIDQIESRTPRVHRGKFGNPDWIGLRSSDWTQLGWTTSLNPFDEIATVTPDGRLLSGDRYLNELADTLKTHGVTFVNFLQQAVKDGRVIRDKAGREIRPNRARQNLLKRYERLLQTKLFAQFPGLKEVWGSTPRTLLWFKKSSNAREARELLEALGQYERKVQTAANKIKEQWTERTQKRQEEERLERERILMAAKKSELNEVCQDVLPSTVSGQSIEEFMTNRDKLLEDLRSLANKVPRLRKCESYLSKVRFLESISPDELEDDFNGAGRVFLIPSEAVKE